MPRESTFPCIHHDYRSKAQTINNIGVVGVSNNDIIGCDLPRPIGYWRSESRRLMSQTSAVSSSDSAGIKLLYGLWWCPNGGSSLLQASASSRTEKEMLQQGRCWSSFSQCCNSPLEELNWWETLAGLFCVDVANDGHAGWWWWMIIPDGFKGKRRWGEASRGAIVPVPTERERTFKSL